MLLIIFLSLGIVISSTAQDYQIKNFTVNNNGTSHTVSNKMVFDENGVLWYSVANGMVKEFETANIFYPFMDGEKPVLVKRVRRVFMDSKNRFWVITDNDVFRSDASKEKFQKLDWDVFDNMEGATSSIVEDCEGSIWMTIALTKVLKVDTEDRTKVFSVTEVPKEYRHSNLKINSIYGCNSIILQRNKFHFFINDSITKPLISPKWVPNNGYSIIASKNGEIFPKDYEGHYTFQDEKFKVTLLKTLDLQLMEIKFGMLPISRTKTPELKESIDFMLVYDRRLQFFRLANQQGQYYINSVEGIQFDYLTDDIRINKDGVIHVSNFDKIYKIKFKNRGFSKELHGYKMNNQKVNISTRDFLEVNANEIYIASYEGIFKISRKAYGASFEVFNAFPGLSYLRVQSRVNDSIIICAGEKTMVKVDIKNQKIIDTKYFTQHKDYRDIIFYDIKRFKDSLFIIGTDSGLMLYNNKNDEFVPYKLFPILSDSAKFVRNIDYHQDRLYISTDANGLFIQDLKTKKVTNIASNTNSDSKLPSNRVYTTCIDSNERLWVGTDKGIVCLNMDGIIIESLNKDDGLLDENVVGIQEDALGNIWFSTYNGLYKYENATQRVFSYFKHDGLPDNEFNQNSYHTASDGTLYFGGVNGIVAFDTIVDNTPKDIKILPIKVEYFDTQRNKDTVIISGLDKEQSFKLPTKNSSLSMDFSVNDFFNIENNRYAYKVEGLTEEWVNLGSQNTFKRLSIPPGDYTLKIKGLNSKGVSSINELSYKIHVPQVLYKRTWFIIALIVLISGIITIIVFNYILKQKKKYKMDLMLMELEQKALRTQMNPHFIFNTLNGMRKKAMNGSSDEVEEYIVSFSEFLRHTLDIGRRENIFLSKEIEYISSYVDLINYGNNDNIVLKVQLEESVDQHYIKLPSMVLQPIVENAVIHGFQKSNMDKEIHLKIRKNILSQQIEVIIEDNGIGINASLRKKKNRIKSHQSYATQIVNERFDLLNKTQKSSVSKYELLVEDITNETRSGTRVTLKIPYL